VSFTDAGSPGVSAEVAGLTADEPAGAGADAAAAAELVGAAAALVGAAAAAAVVAAAGVDDEEDPQADTANNIATAAAMGPAIRDFM